MSAYYIGNSSVAYTSKARRGSCKCAERFSVYDTPHYFSVSRCPYCSATNHQSDEPYDAFLSPAQSKCFKLKEGAKRQACLTAETKAALTAQRSEPFINIAFQDFLSPEEDCDLPWSMSRSEYEKLKNGGCKPYFGEAPGCSALSNLWRSSGNSVKKSIKACQPES